jgi:pimeloyl-ACP methyl ester carboxylesterase
MTAQIHALLVGINDYAAPVRKLTGCVNDVDHFHAWLKESVGADRLAVEVLKDGEATRANIIRQFRKHLGRVRPGDVALFQYCGHGAQSLSAGAFREFDLGGFDEGLVCADSRLPGGHDLADKELALLIDELSRKDAHVAFILDACHSGSGTRSADAFSGLQPRLTEGVRVERPLDSYLDGHYARLLKKGERLAIPSGRHILLAACERRQEAQESPTEHSGVFTSTLLEVLQASGGSLSYADLFMRCRAAVRKRAHDQDPQFEPIGQFNPWGGFLGRHGASRARTYHVSFERKAWRINCGAMHGMPTDPDKPVGVALYAEGDTEHPVASGTTIEVGTQDAILDLGDFAADPAASYSATLTSLPVAPLLLHMAADAPARAALAAALAEDAASGCALTEVADGARYGLDVQRSRLCLSQRESGVMIQAAKVFDNDFEAAASALLPVLKQVAQWERSLALRNTATQIDASLIDFVVCEPVDGGADFVHPGSEVTLESVKQRGEWQPIPARLLVRNRSRRPLHCVLVYFSAAYGIDVLPSALFAPGDEYTTLFESGEGFHMEVGTVAESIDRFKLIVSTQPIDGFLLMQEALELGATVQTTRAISGGLQGGTRKSRQDDWLTKDLRVRVVPRLNELGDKDWASDNGAVRVKGHPTLKAKLSMSPARPGTRGAGEGASFVDAFERAGLALASFANTRGDSPNVLELSDIQGGDALKAQPLEIEIDLPLADDEGILPFVYDGRHVLLGGDASKDEAGRTHISIDHLHELPSDRRSLGGSLKLYFFKTYLKQRRVNRLRWVEYGADGKATAHEDGVAAKVATARRVLLLVHGIIGDTEGMAAGVKACGLEQKFDLVLSYDYENLSTPIEATARELKAQLAEAGLHDTDGAHLTLLVHSMGGLVSRWFIEREGGHRIVDHLVMCGTPNNGSPFGKVEDARRILNVLTGLAANYVPALLPFSAPILFLLNRSKKVTPTLMQMNPDSDFIRALNASPDPGIPYTILAGDVDAYDEPTDAFFAQLVAKMGQGVIFDLLFRNQANDIAVSIDSITRVGAARAQLPASRQVACHHLNYFVSAAGQQALLGVAW